MRRGISKGKILSIAVLMFVILLTGCGYHNKKVNKVFLQNSPLPSEAVNRAEKSETADNKVLPVATGDLAAYAGPVQHIFFHPLIAYTGKAFDGDSLSKGYNDWFITVEEFDKILESLYKKNYILIDIKDTYDVKLIDGRKFMAKKKLLLPEGKKPLIISIDDVNYYEYMVENGNIHKLILDSNGDVATFSITPEGKRVIAYDNEIIPILDSFVKEHSDFSLHGAKGIIALTGYEGVLGYRTNKTDSPDYENERNEALRLIERLKNTGWSFASHSYGHLDDYEISYDRLVRDTERWEKEVEPLTGPTPIYIYPFGSAVPYSNPKFKYLLNAGFDVFCGVGSDGWTEYLSDCVLTDRRPIDGISFHYNSKKLADLFDCSEIIDSCRPGTY